MTEEGRYRGIDRNLRLCQFYNINFVEDEYHFLLVCPLFNELRRATPVEEKVLKFWYHLYESNLKYQI